ncbi:hypothetical protein D3C72_1601120 [compost metagenome]
MGQAGVNAGGSILALQQAIHGLQKIVGELGVLLQRLQVKAGLGPDEFQLLPAALHPGCPCLGADAQPIDAFGRGHGAVAFDGNAELLRVQRVDEFAVHLQQGLAARQHHQPVARACGPLRSNQLGQGGSGVELATQRPVRAHKVGVAELANGLCAVLLTARPEVAARKTAEHGGCARLAAFALQGVENFFDAVGHWATGGTKRVGAAGAAMSG